MYVFLAGKSSAIQYAAQEPLDEIEMSSNIIHKTTSSGLVKFLASNQRGFIISPEVFDVLFKLLKSDEDNGTGDVQLLCKMFSGEKCSYHFSTESSRVIQKDTPFCLLGSTQLTNAAKLIAKMDQGHGLVDRLLIATPLALRPTLSEMEAAKLQLTEPITDFTEYFLRVSSLDDNTVYSFDANGKRLLRDTLTAFIQTYNQDIKDGYMPPKSKAPELIPRIATSLHVLNHIMEEVLLGQSSSEPPTTISHSTLQTAIDYVQHLESQKDIMCQVNYNSFSNDYNVYVLKPLT